MDNAAFAAYMASSAQEQEVAVIAIMNGGSNAIMGDFMRHMEELPEAARLSHERALRTQLHRAPEGKEGGADGRVDCWNTPEPGPVEDPEPIMTEVRYDALRAKMASVLVPFDINRSKIGPKLQSTMEFALGWGDDPIDVKAVALVFGAPDVSLASINGSNPTGQTYLMVSCAMGRR